MNKKDWHWKCRWFNHKYAVSHILSERLYHYDVCVRCGFDPTKVR